MRLDLPERRFLAHTQPWLEHSGKELKHARSIIEKSPRRHHVAQSLSAESAAVLAGWRPVCNAGRSNVRLN